MKRILRKPLIYFGLALTFLFVILLSFYFYHQFDLKTVIIIASGSDFKGLEALKNSNLLSLDFKKTSNYLKQKNPLFYSIEAVKQYPQTLILNAKERIAVARILHKNDDNLYADADGIVFTEDVSVHPVPFIRLKEFSIYPGQKADWKMMKAIAFIMESNKQSINIEQITEDDSASSFVITIGSGTQVLLPFNSDVQSKASSLQLILARFRIEGKNISKIDFRYDKPVVTLINGEKISSTF